MNILLLSSNNGEGHNSAARALMDEARRRGHSCFMMDTLMFDSPAHSEAVKKIHVDSALRAPGLFKAGNEIAEMMSAIAKEKDEFTGVFTENAKYAPRIKKSIDDNGVEVVIATHIFAAQAVTYMRCELDSHCGAYFVATDYSCTPFLAETKLDACFIPSHRLLAEFSQKAPGQTYIARGIPVSERLCEKNDRRAARAELGLPQDAPLVMYMTGSMGRGQIKQFAKKFKGIMPPDTRILAMCGGNKKLKESLETGCDGGYIIPVGFTDKIGLYMDAADLLISKPGGLSITEAAVKEIPLVLSKPLPGWEEDNVSFFTRHNLALKGQASAEATQAAVSLLASEQQREQMKGRQREEINKYAARDIMGYIEEHSNK